MYILNYVALEYITSRPTDAAGPGRAPSDVYFKLCSIRIYPQSNVECYFIILYWIFQMFTSKIILETDVTG